MSIIGGIAAGLQIASSVFSFGSRFFTAGAQNDAKKAEYKNQYNALNSQKKLLDDQYENATAFANWDWDNTQNTFGENMAILRQNQITSAQVNAMQGVANEKQTFQNLAYTIENAKAQRGVAINQAAVSGFRNANGTTTSRQLAYVDRSAGEAIDTQREAAKASVNAAYVQSRSNYFNADFNYKQYQNNLAAAKNQYEYQKTARDNEYNYNTVAIDKQIEAAKDAADKNYYWDFVFGNGGFESMSNNIGTIMDKTDILISGDY